MSARNPAGNMDKPDKKDFKKRGAAVCVFCGSSFGHDPAFRDAARAIGAGIAKMGYSLVFGGGGLGLMGEVARAALDGGSDIQGIMPGFLQALEPEVSPQEKLIVTPHLQERKALMLQMSDAFLVLPGGLGTFDEFFEVAVEAQLGVHAKPIIVVNISTPWTPCCMPPSRPVSRRIRFSNSVTRQTAPKPRWRSWKAR